MATYFFSLLIIVFYILLRDPFLAFGLSILCWITKDIVTYLIGINEEAGVKKIFKDFKGKYDIDENN